MFTKTNAHFVCIEFAMGMLKPIQFICMAFSMSYKKIHTAKITNKRGPLTLISLVSEKATQNKQQ